LTGKIEISTFRFIGETIKRLDNPGLLLVSGSLKRANVMTIGWGLLGILWGKPFFLVAVRPSRYTFQFIEETGDFTVNVPRKGMEETVNYCGTVSGRDHDKFKEKELTLLPSRQVSSPIIGECMIHYECRVAYKTNVVREALPSAILSACYPGGNYHTLYFGEIVAVRADEELDLDLEKK